MAQITTAQAPFFIQESPEEKRKAALASALAGNALKYNPNYASLLGPIAQTMAGAMSGYMYGQAGESTEARTDEARDAMAQALSAYNDPSTYTDPSQGVGPVPYRSAPDPSMTPLDAMQGTMMQNKDLAPYAMKQQMDLINAKEAAKYKTPDYMKISDPLSPTGASWALKTNPYLPITPAPAGSQGLDVSFGPDGLERISFGGQIQPGGEVSSPTSTTKSRVQEKAFNTGERLSRLNAIEATYQPKFSSVGTRMGKSWDSLVAKFDADSLDTATQTELAEYGVWKKRSFMDMNLYFNELSGAAVSPEEAERLTNGLPVPGEGWFDGDDPITYNAKLQDSINQGKRALIRYNLFMKVGDAGGNPWDIPLYGDALESAINDYAADIEQRLAPSYPNKADLQQAVMRQLKTDGIGY